MTARPVPAEQDHIDAVARVLLGLGFDGEDSPIIANAILTSDDPAVHAALLDALTNAGVLTADRTTDYVQYVSDWLEVQP